MRRSRIGGCQAVLAENVAEALARAPEDLVELHVSQLQRLSNRGPGLFMEVIPFQHLAVALHEAGHDRELQQARLAIQHAAAAGCVRVPGIACADDEIEGSAVHGAEHAVRNVGRPGILEELAATRMSGHGKNDQGAS